MEQAKRLFFILIVLFLSVWCVGAYVNRNYNVERNEERRLAIAPVLPDEDPTAAFVDSLFVVMFEDPAKPGMLVTPSHIRSIMENDETVARIVSVMHGTEYTKAEMKAGATILKTTGMDELVRGREACGDADLCLVPRVWDVSSSAGRAFGQCTFRLYDLHTGQMIYEKSDDLNVSVGGKLGQQLISGHLIGLVQEYYATMMEK